MTRQSMELQGGAEAYRANTEAGAFVGQTVFELLAQPMEVPEAQHPQRPRPMTQTIQPTQHVTGQPPRVGVDRDSEPDSVLD